MLIELRTLCGGPSSHTFEKFLHCKNSTSLSHYFYDRCQIGYNLDHTLLQNTKPYHYLEQFYFPQDIKPLKAGKPISFACRKPVIIFNKVINDGFGDFAIAQSMMKAYLKNCDCHIECRVFSDPEHLEKARIIFKESIQEIQKMAAANSSLNIKWIDEAEEEQHANELVNDDSRIVIAASTGYLYFNSNSSVDCLHEMSPPPPNFFNHTENEYTPERLSLKLGFSPTSAGVMLPEKATYSLEAALDSSGCLSRIRNQIGKPDAPLSEILENNDITILYMKNPIPQERYISFMESYAEITNKTIHIIAPTDEPDALEAFQQEVAPNVILHYCPFLKTKNFQAIVQQATVPPGITGNDTFLNALVGHTPFFCDGRTCIKPIIGEFITFCADQPLHWATECYLSHLERMAIAYRGVSYDDIQKAASLMHANRQLIREDLEKIHEHIRKTCNAETLLCNRLRERSAHRLRGDIELDQLAIRP